MTEQQPEPADAAPNDVPDATSPEVDPGLEPDPDTDTDDENPGFPPEGEESGDEEVPHGTQLP